jgi:hypothetical protein
MNDALFWLMVLAIIGLLVFAFGGMDAGDWSPKVRA